MRREGPDGRAPPARLGTHPEEFVPSILYSEVRKGMVIRRDDGQLYYVVDRELRTPGNLPSKLTLKLKNVKTGFVNEQRVHPEDKVEQAYLEKREMQYS